MTTENQCSLYCCILIALSPFKVVQDIFKQLKLKSPVASFKTPCFRSNLFYDVVFSDTMDDPCENLKDFIKDSLYDVEGASDMVIIFFIYLYAKL